jgi:hypothetical protein
MQERLQVLGFVLKKEIILSEREEVAVNQDSEI